MQSPTTTWGSRRQYLTSIGTVILVTAACYPLGRWRRRVERVHLDFFFIPPHFTLTVGNVEDGLMLAMYFIITLLNGVLTHEIRKIDKIARCKEDKEHIPQLHNTLFNFISHDFRTPVATIWAASENLLADDQPWTPADRRQMTGEIHYAAERLNRLVYNLLNMSRLEAGHLVPNRGSGIDSALHCRGDFNSPRQ